MATETEQRVTDFIVTNLTQYSTLLTTKYNTALAVIANADAKIAAAQAEKADAETTRDALTAELAEIEARLNGYNQ